MSLRQVRCCLSVCQSVSLSVRPSVRLSHFSFLALCFVYFLFVAGSINFSRWTCAALFHWALRGPLPKPTSTPMSTSTRAELWLQEKQHGNLSKQGINFIQGVRRQRAVGGEARKAWKMHAVSSRCCCCCYYIPSSVVPDKVWECHHDVLRHNKGNSWSSYLCICGMHSPDKLEFRIIYADLLSDRKAIDKLFLILAIYVDIAL